MRIDLDPELAGVVQAVPGWDGLQVVASALPGGITNRNFRVEVAGQSYVVRLPGGEAELLGIDRDAEREAAEAAAAAAVGPEVVCFLPEPKVLVTRFVEAETIPVASLEDREVLSLVVDAIKRIHALPPLRSSFDPFEIVHSYRAAAEEHGVGVPAAFDEAASIAGRIARARPGPPPLRPCHNDLLNANFLRCPDRVLIVDYEYAGMGDPFFDLGNFSVNNGLSAGAERLLLELYFGSSDPLRYARLKLMQIMSDFREAMWGVVQQGISSLDFDYAGYASHHFARCLERAGDGRFGGWLDETAKGG